MLEQGPQIPAEAAQQDAVTAEINASQEVIDRIPDFPNQSGAEPHTSTVKVQEAITTYEAPQPKRSQRLAMKAAGILMQRKSAKDTLERVATDIGGYEVREVDGKKQFSSEVDRKITMSKWDETADSRPMVGFKSGADFFDSIGVELSTAVNRTSSKARQSGSMATSVRGRAVRRLVKHATKGDIARAHIK